MIREWIDELFGGEISLREKMVRIVLSVGLAVSAFSTGSSILSGESTAVILYLLVGTLVLGFAMREIVYKQRTELAAVLFGVTVNICTFPVLFLLRGGINSGTSLWFVLGIVFVFLLFRGKKFYFFLGLTIVALISSYCIACWNPALAASSNRRGNVYMDMAVSAIMVGVIIGSLIKFQDKVYENERDISERQKEEIEQMSQSKSVFFANMSHEIRTPINTIIGLNEMILREDISDEIAENAINIQNASKMLLALINDILDLSKIESGKMEIVPTQYETGAMFSDLVNIIWIRAHEKKLEFKIDISPEIPSMLYGDEVRIKQVLTNFLTNAVKYTKAGSVTLTAKSEQREPNKVRLRISVADTGMGIRKEDIDNLFLTYKRVDQEKNRKIEGTGLGLAISKQLIEMMGGTITVDSIYTKGSVFTVTLDQHIVDDCPIGPMDFAIKKKIYNRAKYKQSFEAPDARILIVDDNEMNLMVACKLLRATKVRIDTAVSGKECLEKTRHRFYNVIFMDHMMPEMDGIETLKQVRQQENGLCSGVPVIALTANAMAGADKIYQDNGFQGYLAKPINGALFEATLLKYLPDELVEYGGDAGETAEEQSAVTLISKNKKMAVRITTDCVCDLPDEWLKRFDVTSMYYYVYTNQGRFCDVSEITSDNLLSYLAKEGNEAYSSPASVEEYETFFANVLEEAEKVIHISMASKASKGYETAYSASKGFGNVTVIDSGHLSSGMGMMVLYAAKMARERRSAEEICQKMYELKDYVSTSFIVPSPENLYRNGKIAKGVRNLCVALELHPVLYLKQSKIICGRVENGRIDKAYQKYIRHEMKKKNQIDSRILFITYAGCSVRLLQEIREEVSKYMKFDHVVFQKASATISSNCGLGAFGLLYLLKE